MPNFQGLQYSTPLTVNSNQRELITETLNLKRQAVGNGSQRWELQITLAPSDNREAVPGGARLGVHRTINGLSSSFDIPMPQPIGLTIPSSADIRPVATSSGEVSGGEGLLRLRRLSGQPDVDLSIGTYFAIANSDGSPDALHRKVYQIIDTVTVDDNTTNVTIFPPLLEDVGITKRIDLSPDLLAYYAQDGSAGVTYSDGILTQATISVIEALQ